MVDFELLSEKPKRPTFFEELERLIGNRKWAWQRWSQKPPQLLAFAVLFGVVVELTISAGLLKGEGVSISVLHRLGMVLLLVTGVEVAMAVVAAQASEIFGTPGKARVLLTYFNLSLTPLLLILPVTLVTYIGGRANAVRLVLYFVLIVKVLGNWRDAIEFVYKFTKMQSAIVMYVASAIACIVMIAVAYLTLFNRIVASFT